MNLHGHVLKTDPAKQIQSGAGIFPLNEAQLALPHALVVSAPVKFRVLRVRNSST
jgi:hypothetical protein